MDYQETNRFIQLLGDRSFYGPIEAARSAMDRCAADLAARSAGLVERLDTELALIRWRRVRQILDFGAVAGELERIERLVGTHSRLALQYRIVRAECRLHSIGDLQEAKQEFESIASELRHSREHVLYALVAINLSIVYMHRQDLGAAEECCQDALSTFRRLGIDLLHAHCLNNYGVIKKKQCHYIDAEKLHKNALEIFESIGATEGQTQCVNNLAILKMKVGDWRAAQYYIEKALKVRYATEFHRHYSYQFTALNLEGNLTHLYVMQRVFSKASDLASRLFHNSHQLPARALALVHEFLGEMHSEMGEHEPATEHLAKAREIAERIAPESDLMAEIRRREAQNAFLRGDFSSARRHALDCIRLCRKIEDKHELGAALRILGEVYVRQGLPRKAISAFEASINTLKSIGECYELMRCCIAYSEFLIDTKGLDADIYLLEAKQLCKKLEIDFYMAKIMLLSSKYAHNNNDYMAARAYLKKADEIADKLQECDRKQLKPEIQRFYKTLEKTILQTSMESSQKLKSIGKIYEDARFPIEELKPELATEVALNVGADQLFLVRKKNKGFRVPIKYNISAEDARRLIRFQLRDNEHLFDIKAPTIIPLPAGNTLVCVPGQTPAGYLLCTLIDKERSFTPRELEFLFASVEAMERVAEEYAELPPYLDMDDFMEGGDEKLTHPGGNFQDILTLDPEMIKMIRLAERASDTNVSILLEGETGVGKELFANAIHAQSPRKNKQFIAVNAGGVPLTLLESQLFGHIRGAFTDAVTDRHGLIEEARGGTVFFDEVGEMAEELQVKLLRLLENGEYRRLGENALRIADVRVISATNKNLEQRVKEGLFREDLYYRLATVRFKIPPLRNRKRDVEFLVRHFINEGLVRIGKPRRRINVDVKALEAFEIYGWPGNVRELRNELLRILSLIGQADVIRFGMLSEHVKAAFQSKGEDGGLLEKRVDRYERRLILKALEENEWSRNKTAEQIGIPRTTLLFKMKRLNIVA